MGSAFSEAFPPEARLTEKNCSEQTGKVFIVTGASAGVGKELAQILYSKNATVYVAARSKERCEAAIESIKSNVKESTGVLHHLHLDLGDLSTIKQSANDFLAKEKRLDVLWNNAGVMIPPQGSKTVQNHELQLGTNNIGPYLFTKLLTPILQETAKTSPAGSVRVVWLASSAVRMAPTGGIDMQNLDYKVEQTAWKKYGASKAGNFLHAREFARRYPEIISVACNPGNLRSDLQRHVPAIQNFLIGLILYTPIHGAYTELFCGLSPEVTFEKNGAWVIPWGRFGTIRKDIDDATRLESEGGTGNGAKFWDWTDEQVKAFI